MLHEFIAFNRDEIIRRCRAKVATRSVPPPTEAEIDHGVPLFLDQLVSALRSGLTNPEISRSAVLHGHDLLRQGFTVSQVVHDYGDICQSITDLAMKVDAPISTHDFRTLNQCLDDAIAGAVTEFGRGRNQSTLDGEAARGTERLGFLAHELRNLMNTALLALEVLRTGNVGVAGSTGQVLHRSLIGARDLIGRSLAEVRLTQGIENRERVQMSDFIDGLLPAATLEANARGLTLAVVPVEEGVAIEADRQVLAAVIGNLLQNAFKFTHPHTTVTLRVGASAERVLIEIEDECGGLSGGTTNDELFRPFEQRSADRTGLGLGLAFSGVEANHGRIYARTLPGNGCIFTVDMSRCPTPAETVVFAKANRTGGVRAHAADSPAGAPERRGDTHGRARRQSALVVSRLHRSTHQSVGEPDPCQRYRPRSDALQSTLRCLARQRHIRRPMSLCCATFAILLPPA
jgi:signal transduction histidine kinase